MAEDGNVDNRLEYTKRPLTDVPMTKGGLPLPAEYARGGPVLRGPSIFIKGTTDTFRTDDQRQNYKKTSKGGEFSDLEGDDKSVTPVKPRK